MTISYSDAHGAGDLTVDLSVGNLTGCFLRAYLYGEDGKLIDKEPIADLWIKSNESPPEYRIPAAILAANKRLTIKHIYDPANFAGLDFRVVSAFTQGAKAQSEIYKNNNLPVGVTVTHWIELERGGI